MTEEKKKPGCIWPILWILAALVGTVVCAAIVIFFASGSESDGVTATYVVAFPFGALWSGAIAAIGTYFLKSDSKGVRYGAPFGCGCLGGIFLFTMIVFFFVAIFPSL